MTDGRPTRVAIDHDDYHARYVGHTADGRQFFLTTPFTPPTDDSGVDGTDFVALYLFDAAGRLVDARIDALGPQTTVDDDAVQRACETRLSELGPVTYGRIEVEPFEIQRFGVAFGLIARGPEDDRDRWWVELEPGNCMAFTEPWDSGYYDT